MVPEHVGGDDGDAALLHLAHLGCPFGGGNAAVMHFAHHGHHAMSVDKQTMAVPGHGGGLRAQRQAAGQGQQKGKDFHCFAKITHLSDMVGKNHVFFRKWFGRALQTRMERKKIGMVDEIIASGWRVSLRAKTSPLTINTIHKHYESYLFFRLQRYAFPSMCAIPKSREIQPHPQPLSEGRGE